MKTRFNIFVLLGVLLFISCQDSKQKHLDTASSGFKMILRLWPSHHTDTILRNELLTALQEYPKTFDEVWFCMEINTLSVETHRKSAEAMAIACKKMKDMGLTTSIQGITLGHGDSFEANTEVITPTEWGTIIDAQGRVTLTGNCPRQPGYHKYLAETYALYAERCQPSILWLDDDLRVTRHPPAHQLCFCDTCIHQFNRQHGSNWIRETLVEALDENKGQGDLRKQWIEFSQESLAEIARTISKSVHRVSPKTRMGLQHANFHHELLEGRDWNPIFDVMKEETGLTPASRPGSGFYNDHAPRGMVTKGYDMARQIRRLNSDIQEITAEVEGYFHYATGKSPHGLRVESQLYLAMGATQLSYAIICSASEPMEWYADNYFYNLQTWRSFYEEYAAFNQGTEPGGMDPYISPDQVMRDKRPDEHFFGWTTTNSGRSALGMSFLGIPFCPDGNFPVGVILDKEAIEGLGHEEAHHLFNTQNVLLDAVAWKHVQDRKLDTLLTLIPSPETLSNVSCFVSSSGMRTVVIPSYGAAISNTERLNLLYAIDWVSHDQLPVIMETMAQAVIIPRINNKGQLRSVTVLNGSISEQPETELRLRGCDTKNKKQTFVWKKAGQPDIHLLPRYDGNDVIIRIPVLEGWNIGWLAVK